MSRSFVGRILTNVGTLAARQRANPTCSRTLSASFSSGTPRAGQRIPLGCHSTSSGRRTSVAADLITICLLGINAYYLANLEATPFSGRWRFMDVSPDHEAQIIEEARRDAQQEFEGKLLQADHVLNIHMHRIVDNILQSNNLGRLGTPTELATPQPITFALPTTEEEQYDAVPNDTPWKLFIVNDDRIAKVKVEYGTIVISTGIIPLAKDEHGLAAIIGHELGHLVARHRQERISAAKPILIPDKSILSRFFNVTFSPSQYLSKFPRTSLSEEQETEADLIGLKIMTRACYIPRAALFVLLRMGEFEEAYTILGKHNRISTHPTFSKRLQAMLHYLSETYTRDQLASFHRSQHDGIVKTLALPLQSQ